MHAQRAESEARLQAAEAAYEESEAFLASSQESALLARDQYDRVVTLMPSKSISQAEFDEAEHHHRMAQAALRSSEFRAKVRLFEKELARTALLRFTDIQVDEKVAAINIQSPIDGLVLRVLREDSGVVSAGTAVLEIGDASDMEIQIDVLSVYAVAIQPGAKLTIDHWGGKKPLLGVVRVVEPSAFLKISALGVEEKRVKIIADFMDPWEERKTLGDGYRIEARIVAKSTDVASLKVAAGSLFRHRENWHVYRVRNGRTAMIPVTIGESNGMETEIREGLVDGDCVVLHPSDKIRNGIRVQSQPAPD